MKDTIILVVIVSYNSMQWARICYDSLRQSTIPCRIMTIDNGSTDGTQEYIRSHYPEVELVETGANLGFGKANNIGLQKALDDGYEYVYLLNQDAWIKPDTFEKLIAISKKYPEYGILSPMQMQANEEHLDCNFCSYSIGTEQKYYPRLIEDLYFKRLFDVYETNDVMAAHWFITRNCIEIVGGFSPTFTHYGEDNNYCKRVRYWKMKIGVVPGCHAVHDRETRPNTSEKIMYFEHYIAKLDKFSNPLCTVPVMSLVKEGLRQSLMRRDKVLFKYTCRILKEKKQIEANLARSLKPCAFLK